jgi:hypothetical protein
MEYGVKKDAVVIANKFLLSLSPYSNYNLRKIFADITVLCTCHRLRKIFACAHIVLSLFSGTREPTPSVRRQTTRVNRM